MVLLIGIPASGKSTFATKQLSTDYQRISLDLLKNRAREAKVFSDAIAKRKSVVIDNTNVTRTERRRFIEPARAAGYEVIGYFFQSVLRDCLQRNALRSGKECIPDVGVIARSSALEMPSVKEGFDKLFFVSISDGGFSINEWRNDNEEK